MNLKTGLEIDDFRLLIDDLRIVVIFYKLMERSDFHQSTIIDQQSSIHFRLVRVRGWARNFLVDKPKQHVYIPLVFYWKDRKRLFPGLF